MVVKNFTAPCTILIKIKLTCLLCSVTSICLSTILKTEYVVCKIVCKSDENYDDFSYNLNMLEAFVVVYLCNSHL